MVKITNHIDTFEVSNGAYESIFKAQGFTKVNEDGDVHVDHGDEPMSDEDKFLMDIVEKPLSQWSKSEVKKYVDLKGIDTTGASTLAEVKEMIKHTIV